MVEWIALGILALLVLFFLTGEYDPDLDLYEVNEDEDWEPCPYCACGGRCPNAEAEEGSEA